MTWSGCNTSTQFRRRSHRNSTSKNSLNDQALDLYFYVVAIRPELEYACPVWHSSLTAAQTKTLESLQRREMRIIFPENDYLTSLIFASVDTLETRREQLTERFFRRSVLRETSCLHYLLLDKRDPVITDRLRHAKTFASFSIRTEKFRKSFILYCLNNFD